MIVEGLQFKNTRDTMLTRSDCGSRSSDLVFSAELQLHFRMFTLVPILSFDNQ